MAQNYVVATVSIKDESQNQLKTGDYKAILLTFNSPGLRQIGVTSSLGSFSGNYENQIFQIVFPNQGSAEVWGSPFGTQTKWKVVSKVDGNQITITIKDATGSNSVEEIQVLAQDGTNWNKLNLSNNPSQVVISLTFAGPPQVEDGGLDGFGMKMLLKSKGNKVAMQKSDEIHENGQRYNVNHKFENHLMQGYYKLGEGQKKIETKEDGPNHGSCDFFDDQICFWIELGIDLETGKAESQYEWHHNDNFEIPDDKNTVLDSVGPLKAGNWVGWATACYWGPEGLRHYKAWCDPNPFPNNDPTQKPLNNWKLVVHLIHTADLIKKGSGNVSKPIIIPRDMSKVINYRNGFECEIRMHKATEGDDDMKNCFVYEIMSPS